MSSPTELSVTARRAQSRSSLSKLLGGGAAMGALGLMGLFIWQAGVLAPPAPQDIKNDDTVEKPEQITSQNASIAGTDKNNLPFEIHAKSGEQDKALENIVHMQTVTSVFKRPSGSKLDVSSDTGRYDRKTKGLELNGNVVFSEGERFRAVMQKAAIDTQNQSLASQSPVKVDMQGTLIEANSLEVTSGGTRLLFKGGVKAHFEKKKTTGDGG
jgi:lipopolysaccharide export system protein LptC